MNKNLKKFMVVMLSLVLVIGVIGCGADDAATDGDGEGMYTPGTYEASAEGYGGPVMLEVEFSSDKIESVKVVDHDETDGIGSEAVDQLPGEIVEGQTLDVEAVSGATLTSTAIIDAVSDTVEQAGGDPASLK